VWNSTANGVTIRGNSIGVGANGTAQIVSGNTEDLIYIGGGGSVSNLLIGGSTAGEGNTIAFSDRSGIRLDTSGSNLQVIGNVIRNNTRNGIYLAGNTRAAIISNRIFANGMLGIDLGDNGVTVNDAGDDDSGANDLLNFPSTIRAIINGPNALGYNFTLDAPAAASGYRVEFFASSAADPSGFGEGEHYLGHVDITHPGGAQNYTGTLTTSQPISIGDLISATTTQRTGSGSWDITSEFSAVVTADGVAALSLDMTTELFDPPAGQAFFAPGNDVLVSATISNGGNGNTDPDSIFVTIAIDPANAVFNDVTPLLGGVVGFESGAPSLSFTPATDLRFSSAAAAPASFAQCTYTPAPGYDPQVRHVCLNPKGTLPGGAPQGQFTVRLRARIN
jgi:parallel beta-helix repeat protein